MIECCDRIPNKHGKRANGKQRYKCPLCKKTFSEFPDNPGRKLLGDRKLTNAERKKRQREKAKYGQASFVPVEVE